MNHRKPAIFLLFANLMLSACQQMPARASGQINQAPPWSSTTPGGGTTGFAAEGIASPATTGFPNGNNQHSFSGALTFAQTDSDFWKTLEVLRLLTNLETWKRKHSEAFKAYQQADKATLNPTPKHFVTGRITALSGQTD